MANSYIDYTGNGSLTTFTAPSYLEKTHIQVVVDGVVKTLNTDYSIADGSTSVVFGTAPAAASKIRISRSSSPDQRLTDYTDASLLTADAMDRDANQLFFLAQEAVDSAERTDFGAQTFYSSGTTDPSTANAGDLFFNSQTGLLKIYNGSSWESVNNRGHKQTFPISGSTTVFTPSNPVDANTLVFLNGVLLVKGSGSDGDYTTSSTQVTLNVAVTSGVVEIVSFPNAAFVGTVNAVDGVFSGNLTADTLNTATLSTTYQPISGGFFTPYTRLRETGNGSFRLEGEGVEINVSDGTATNFSNNVTYGRVVCTGGSANGVVLKHGTGDTKLSTTATGIDVTGTVTTDLVKLNPTGGASEGGQIEFERAVDNQTAWYVDAHGSGTDTSLRFVDNDDTNNPVTRVSMNNTGIDVTGTVDCDGLKMDDGEYAQFGTGNDLQIFHNGTDSYIRDRGTGNLNIQTDGDRISIYDNANTRTMAQFNTNGAANLYWAGSSGQGLKLETTSTGIDVTGGITSDYLDLTGGESTTTTGNIACKEIILNDPTSGGTDLARIYTEEGLNNQSKLVIHSADDPNDEIVLRTDNNVNTLIADSTGINVTGGITSDYLDLTGGKSTTTTGEIALDKLKFSAMTTDEATIFAEVNGDVTTLVLNMQDDAHELIEHRIDGATPLKVKKAGIDVTGTITCDDALTISSDGSGDDAKPDIWLFNNATAADGERLGQITYYGKNSAAETTNYGWQEVKTVDVTDGVEDSVMEFWVRNGAGNHNKSLTLNKDGIDVTGDIEVNDNTKGVILKSPDGSRFRLEVANDGTLSTEAL